MEIKRNVNGNEEVFVFQGRLDTTTGPILETELDKGVNGSALVFDFTNLEYVSSAGLRLILKAYKMFTNNFKLVGVSEEIKEVLEVTGFSDFLTINK